MFDVANMLETKRRRPASVEKNVCERAATPYDTWYMRTRMFIRIECEK